MRHQLRPHQIHCQVDHFLARDVLGESLPCSNCSQSRQASLITTRTPYCPKTRAKPKKNGIAMCACQSTSSSGQNLVRCKPKEVSDAASAWANCSTIIIGKPHEPFFKVSRVFWHYKLDIHETVGLTRCAINSGIIKYTARLTIF